MPSILRRGSTLAGWLLATLLGACASLPPLEPRTASTALSDTASTTLGRAVARDAAAHPGLSGFHAITAPSDGFAARVLLADAAERSLDVQYYDWNGDQAGILLFDALRRAADRGVRVRLLLDDVNMAGLDPTLATLDAHPNIELRLYNPFVHRERRLLDFVVDFGRVNRRMHNKSFTADNQVAIVGGRNVGNEYFGAGDGVEFTDLDVIAAGPIVRDVSAAFDLYWNSASAYPAAALLPKPDPGAAARLDGEIAAVRAEPDSQSYLAAARDTPLVRDLVAKRLTLEWTRATLVRDDPAKTLAASEDSDLLLANLLPVAGQPERSFDLVSPYFVPGEDGTAALVALARRGVRVRVLTNSLAATDVEAVHAGYAKRREALLAAGVRLYEFKAASMPEATRVKKSVTGSKAGTLHAKTFAIDGRRIFVGSFNFDQRSARLNTEMGLVIESSALAGRLATAFDSNVPLLAYEVRLRTDGAGLEWIDRSPSGEVRHDAEPGTDAFKRAWIRTLAILPIEWLL